jgi:cytochrome P450
MTETVHSDGEMARQGYLVLDRYLEVEEVLRRQDEFVAVGNRGELAQEFLRDTLIDLDGEAHYAQRRLLAKTMTDSRAVDYAELIRATLDAELAPYEALAASGRSARFDLVVVARHIFWRLGALMVGVDGVDVPERLERLEALVGPAGEGITVLFSQRDPDVVMSRARQAAADFRHEFYEPSRDRRRALLARATADELPTDMLTLMLQAHPDPAFDDQVYRQALQALSASVGNTVGVTCHGLVEIRTWLAEDEPDTRAVSRTWLAGAVDETIRVHRTGNPYLIRRSLTDTELRSTGRTIPIGTAVAMNIRSTNRDPEMFGADPERFDPGRATTRARVKGYGLGFGTGPHVCLAKRLIVNDVANDERPRLVDTVLARLLQLGVTVDPESPVVPEAHGAERFESFPVRLSPRDRIQVGDPEYAS